LGSSVVGAFLKKVKSYKAIVWISLKESYVLKTIKLEVCNKKKSLSLKVWIGDNLKFIHEGRFLASLLQFFHEYFC
jgi:hypothetical protein